MPCTPTHTPHQIHSIWSYFLQWSTALGKSHLITSFPYTSINWLLYSLYRSPIKIIPVLKGAFSLERSKICNDQEALHLEGRPAHLLEWNSTFERLRTKQHTAFVLRCTGIDWSWHLWAPRNEQIQVPPGCLLCQPTSLSSSGRFLGLCGRLNHLTIFFPRSVNVNEAVMQLK